MTPGPPTTASHSSKGWHCLPLFVMEASGVGVGGLDARMEVWALPQGPWELVIWVVWGLVISDGRVSRGKESKVWA